jgi:hypothetical protein
MRQISGIYNMCFEPMLRTINIDMYMFNLRYCCYSKPILDVADNKYAESAAVLMLKDTSSNPN